MLDTVDEVIFPVQYAVAVGGDVTLPEGFDTLDGGI